MTEIRGLLTPAAVTRLPKIAGQANIFIHLLEEEAITFAVKRRTSQQTIGVTNRFGNKGNARARYSVSNKL